MAQGMPIIPPRLQMQQQQEVLEKHRRQQQQQQQQQQRAHAQQPPQHSRQPSLRTQHSFDTQGASGRSLNNAISPIRPRALDSTSPTSPTTATTNNNSIKYSNNGTARLRSESNPIQHNSSNNSTSNSDDSSWPTTSHYRANSSGSSATGYSNRSGNLTGRSNTTGSSFQERMKERDREKQQRERAEREAAARAFRDDPTLNALSNQSRAASAAATSAQSTGTALWNRLRAAKDVINATITGEERWPDSDDSDYEGESHTRRILREHADKKEIRDVAAKIAELEATPVIPVRSRSINRNETLRTMIRKNSNNANGSSPTSPSSSSRDYYGQSLRARGESGHQQSRSEDSSRNVIVDVGSGTPATKSNWIGNRFRTSSDASLSEALGRLEGKRNQDALVAQVSHLGSTRARSPHRGNRAYKDNIDVAPPPPLPTPKSSFRQQIKQQQQQQQQQQHQQQKQHQPSPPPSLSPSSSTGSQSRKQNNLGAYGQWKQQQEQQQSSYI